MSVALIESILRAVEDDRIASLATAMARLYERGMLADPNLYRNALPERYARRLIWSDPANRFVVVSMTWAPGQTAGLHDHDGLWGAEIVVTGTMRETAYRLVDHDDDRYRFVAEDDGIRSEGMVSAICPPQDYHAFGNAGTAPARTFHVYCGAMEQCRVFAPEPGGWWRPTRTQLEYDA